MKQMTGNKKIKIIIADDNKSFREAISFLLLKYESVVLIGEAENGRQLIDMKQLSEADVILIDLEMPELNGLEAAEFISWNFNHIKLIALSMFTDLEYMHKIISRGYKGFINKALIYEQFEKALKNVLANKYFFPKGLNKLDYSKQQ